MWWRVAGHTTAWTGRMLTRQRTYALMVRLHDQYGMHDIFAPGFPGLLEAFYVMEQMMGWIMPDVYQTFVCRLCLLLLTIPTSRRSCSAGSGAQYTGFIRNSTDVVAGQHDIHLGVGYKVVHYPLCQYRPVRHAAANMGCHVARRAGCGDYDVSSYFMGVQG